MQVVTDILHLQNQIIVTYKGDYDTFERTRDERLRNQQKAHEANERTRGHIQVCSCCRMFYYLPHFVYYLQVTNDPQICHCIYSIF